MRDSEIEQWVLNEIRSMTNSHVKEVCVLSSSGVVSLNGTVDTRADKLAVQTAAQRAKSVVRVINCLNVRKRSLVRRRARVQSRIAPLPAHSIFPIINVSEVSQIAN